jgi:Dynein heavy chain, N-terminal region 2
MKLGHVWDLKLSPADDERIKEVFRIAAGEMSLEAFLKEIRDYWEPFQLSIVSYKSRGKVVKGWGWAPVFVWCCVDLMLVQDGMTCLQSWMSICRRCPPCEPLSFTKCLKRTRTIGTTSSLKSGVFTFAVPCLFS